MEINLERETVLKALQKVMSAVGYVQRGSRNQQQSYNYASEAAFLDKLRPALLEAGLMMIPSMEGTVVYSEFTTGKGTVMRQAALTIAYTLAHVSGVVWPEKIRIPGCGQDMGDKAVYKALTGANKYALFKLFQIATGDDPEIDMVEPEPVKSKPIASQESPVGKSDDEPEISLVAEVEFILETSLERGALVETWKGNNRDWKSKATPAEWAEIETIKNNLKATAQGVK